MNTKILIRSFLLFALLGLQGCIPTPVEGVDPNGQSLSFKFYTGGEKLDDLLIIGDVNHFGKAQYQIDDPLADIGFRFNSGQRVQAECIRTQKDIIGDDECTEYQVYRSSFDQIPSGSRFFRPSLFLNYICMQNLGVLQ